MLEGYDNTLPYRLGFAAVFFLVMGVRDWMKHPENPTRVYEYLFLVTVMGVWITYGVIHDHITATISPEYFLHAKGLAHTAQPYRIAVTLLAAKATYGPGALMGALLLIANNPSPKMPQLRYKELFQICSYGVLTAGLVAVLMGILSSFVGNHTVLHELAVSNGVSERPRPFMLVWGIHLGSYVGAFLGTVLGTILVVSRRKARTE